MTRREQVCRIVECDRNQVGRGLCRRHYSRWWKYGDPLAGGTPKGGRMRWLLAHVNHRGEECLTWPFTRNPSGYGQVGRSNASRVMCELAHGPAPSPMHEAAHSCGKGHLACVAPEHLSWKTKSENQADRLIHGTAIRGAAHLLSKLTEEKVRTIRQLAGIKTQKEIAEVYGISRQHVSAIVHGHSWGWL